MIFGLVAIVFRETAGLFTLFFKGRSQMGSIEEVQQGKDIDSIVLKESHLNLLLVPVQPAPTSWVGSNLVNRYMQCFP